MTVYLPVCAERTDSSTNLPGLKMCANIHTFHGNPENCLKAAVNPEIGGLTHLPSRVRNNPG